jgi:uncharacterized protein (TIGR03000 family)
MSYRVLPLSFVALALALFIRAPAMAEKPADTHEGKIVSVTGDELVMTGKDGKKHTHTLAPDAEITVDGKASKVEDLKAGMKIKVTTRAGDQDVLTKVEAVANKDEDSTDRQERTEQGRKGDSKLGQERTEQGRKEGCGDRSGRADRARQQPRRQATIVVNLPGNAQLTFDDYIVRSTGPNRVFVTPPLAPGKDFHYTVKAKLTQDGKTETTSKEITVRAGEEARIELQFAKEDRSAADSDTDEALSHEGKVIRATDDTLTMGDMEGKNNHTHSITRDTKITLDGQESDAKKLRPGMRVRVTTKKGNRNIATRIAATSAE